MLCLELERQDRLQFWAAELLLAAMTWHAAETAESRQKTAKALEDAWFRYREVLFPTLRGQRQAFLEKHLQTLTAEQGKAYRIQRDT